MTRLHRRGLALGLVVALATLVGAPAALGHASFVAAEPGPGVRLEQSPERILLTFTEPLNRKLTRASLRSAGGQAVRVASGASSSRRFVLRPRGELAAGAYRIQWHTVSTLDGHALEGTFSFGVRAAALAGTKHQIDDSPLARDGWLRVTLRALLYVAVLLAAAALLVPVLLPRSAPSWLAPAALERVAPAPAAAASRREQRLQVDLAWLAAAAAVGAALAEAADAAGGIAPARMADFLLSGGAGLGRVATVLLLVLAALAARRHPTWSALAAVLALAGIALSGHAASAQPRALAVVNDWVHLVAGAVWVGGIGMLALVWVRPLRRGDGAVRAAVARHVLPSFGRIALPAFLVVSATGLVNLWLQLGALDDLLGTGYGRILLVKIGLVGVIAGLSFAHAFRLRPRLIGSSPPPARLELRHWRLLRAEPVIGAAVLIAVGLLVTFPLPPRQLGDAEDAEASAELCEPCPLPQPRTDELAVAAHAGTQLVAAWVRRDGARMAGTVRVFDLRGKPSRALAEIMGSRSATCGRGCRRFSLPTGDAVRVAVQDRGRRWVATLPARWAVRSSRSARSLLKRAENVMRELRSARQVETVSSGPGSFARTEYRLVAPDRMAFRTSAGTRNVIIGERQWLRAPGTTWTRRRYGSGVPFSTRSWFRWTPYARAVRLLDRRRLGGNPVSELAIMEPATPVWMRLLVDEQTGRVLRETMTARAHFATTRFLDFNRPMEINPPDA